MVEKKKRDESNYSFRPKINKASQNSEIVQSERDVI